MTRVALQDLAYVRYQVADLDLMERFLIDFGLRRAARARNTLYMRGSGPAHHLHVSEAGPANEFLGLAFAVADEAELERAAALPGASAIRPMSGPGGGRFVRLTTPAGHVVDIVHGMAELPAERARRPFRRNAAGETTRRNEPVRVAREPAAVLRLGHCVLWAPDAATETRWFTENFRLVPSDYICAPAEPEPVTVATFLRHDRGDELVEHHVLLVTQSSRRGCHHSSFEVVDLDAVNAGHDYLAGKGWTLEAGVGRHLLGSLVYDYWRDPFGNRVEHYTDADWVNDAHTPTRFVGSIEETTQWGMPPPPSFFE